MYVVHMNIMINENVKEIVNNDIKADLLMITEAHAL